MLTFVLLEELLSFRRSVQQHFWRHSEDLDDLHHLVELRMAGEEWLAGVHLDKDTS